MVSPWNDLVSLVLTTLTHGRYVGQRETMTCSPINRMIFAASLGVAFSAAAGQAAHNYEKGKVVENAANKKTL